MSGVAKDVKRNSRRLIILSPPGIPAFILILIDVPENSPFRVCKEEMNGEGLYGACLLHLSCIPSFCLL